jgi:hypothetical protein
MAERRENSVLFSLRELRNIEEDRVKQEEDAEKARIEAERRAREEEIRRAKEAEEAKRRAEEDAIRREREERERHEREGQLRLQESERRAQIDAAAKLEQARIEAEARARMEAKKFPVGAVVGGVIALVVVAGSVMGYLVHTHNVELAQQQAQLQAKHEEERKALVAQQEAAEKALSAKLADLQGQLDKATNDADRQRIRAQMAAAGESRSRRVASSSKKSDAAAAEPAVKKAKINTKTDDPLGGLPGL